MCMWGVCVCVCECDCDCDCVRVGVLSGCLCVCMGEGVGYVMCMAAGVDAGSHVCLFHNHSASSKTVSILANVHSRLNCLSHSHIHPMHMTLSFLTDQRQERPSRALPSSVKRPLPCPSSSG